MGVRQRHWRFEGVSIQLDADVVILVVVDFVVAVVDLLGPIAHFRDLPHVFSQGVYELAELLFHLPQCLNRQSFSVLALRWPVHETRSHGLVLQHLDLRL